MSRIERAMGALRAGTSRGESVAAVEQQVNDLDALFIEAEAALSPQAANGASTFAAALTILLREGLEALLIVIAMIAFLRKADRPEVLSYVHGGWVAALVAGVVTWAGATYFIDVSGAGRELIELLGLYPSVQVVGAQAIVLAILVAGFLRNQRKAAGPPSGASAPDSHQV